MTLASSSIRKTAARQQKVKKLKTPKNGLATKFVIIAFSGITNGIYDVSRTLRRYHICPTINVDLNNLGEHHFQLANGTQFSVQVIDSIDVYLELMKTIFDFDRIRQYLKGSKARLLIDSLHGVMGPYAVRVFVQELGLSADSVCNAQALPDFGGHHPDPNLTYAAELVEQMRLDRHEFGAAFDGDGDRNMILGRKGFFVTPSDSLAVIAAHLNLIPYFRQNPVSGFARSMPTAPAVDQVAKQQSKIYSTYQN